MSITVPRSDALSSALGIRDLTDPARGPHALQLLVDAITAAVSTRLGVAPTLVRSSPVVTVEDNYDRLGYSGDAITRDERYTHYLGPTTMLRSHTSAGVPPLLRSVAIDPNPPETTVLALPGMCHRRDSIDRQHTGTPHQLDVWVLRHGGRPLDHDDLHDLVSAVVGAAVPGAHWRWTATAHPYTQGGREVEVIGGDHPVEIAECGLASPDVLRAAGLEPREWTGLALGMGLDRALMLRKGIPDIRVLRSTDPRVATQLLDLEPYREVSTLPPAVRDISVAMAPGYDDETIGDLIREALGDDAPLVEKVELLSRTSYADLHDAARERLGIVAGQENLLLRLVLRPVDRTMTSGEANTLRDRIMDTLAAV
jgi:phenylalanyl-tRNA synthetase alpha chain